MMMELNIWSRAKTKFLQKWCCENWRARDKKIEIKTVSHTTHESKFKADFKDLQIRQESVKYIKENASKSLQDMNLRGFFKNLTRGKYPQKIKNKQIEYILLKSSAQQKKFKLK